MPFDFYISNKFYKKPNFDKYEQAKKAFYQDFYSRAELTHLEKWDELNEKFKLLVKNRPQFSIFVDRRKTTHPGRFSLAVDDFLLFLENFYFLLTNKKDYQLTQEQNRTLLTGIEEISSGGLCEPGLATRCNELLVQFRSDMSWIDSELFKQRKNIIKLLADEYNAFHLVSESLSVHTHMYMQHLSETFMLGADDDVKIADVYLRVSSTKPMEDYFKANYQTRFKAYQKEYLDGLMAHLWSVFEKDYKDRFLKDDIQRIKVMDGEQVGLNFIHSPNTTLLKEFLGKYLEGDDSLDSLVIEDEETYEYFLKSSDELKNGLRDALLKKLVNDGFLIKRDKLSEENVKCLHLFSNENISQKLIKAFLVDFRNREHIAKNVDKYYDLLMANTDLLADLILSDTIQLDFLPKQFKKNHNLITNLIKNSSSNDELFLKVSLEIMNNNTAYFFLFSEEQRQQFQSVYQEQFPELFINLDERNLFGDVLKNKVSWYQLRKYSFTIDPIKLYTAFQDNLIQCDEISKGALSRFCVVLEELGYSDDSLGDYFKFKAEKKSFELIKSSYFSYRNYDKKLVLKAIEENGNWLDALFAFQNSAPIYDLQFSIINSLQHQGQTTLLLLKEWFKTFKVLAKKIATLACLYGAYFLGNMFDTCIVKFANYCRFNFPFPFFAGMLFISFLNYYNLSADERYLQYLNLFGAVFLLILPASSFYMNVFLSLYQILPLLISRVTSFFFERPWSIHDIKLYFLELFRQYLMIDIRFYENLFLLVFWHLPKHVFFEWPLMFGGMIVSIILRSVETAKQSLSPKHAMNDASIRVENTIFRLQMMDDISARQKGKILQNIWGQISKDLTENSELTLDSALNKKYAINYKGQEYQYSFNEIAEIKRIKGQEFKLMPKNRWYALFTTTTKSSIHDLSRNLIANPV